jgi:hypothetical protein
VTVISGVFERVREILREGDFVTEILVLGDRLMDFVKEIDADSEEEALSDFDIVLLLLTITWGELLRETDTVRVMLRDTLRVAETDDHTLFDAWIERDRVPVEPNEPVLDGDAIRDRVRDRVRLLDLVIEAERLRETLLLAEGTTRERERVELLETLAERLPDLLREAWIERERVTLEP